MLKYPPFVHPSTMHLGSWLSCGMLFHVIRPLIGAQDLEGLQQPNKNYESVRWPAATRGLLYPQDSETREVHTLDGIWRMVKASPTNPEEGHQKMWHEKGLMQSGRRVIPMAVPSSYNDITVSRSLRDHVGIVWYERTFFVPASWARQRGRRTWLRFGSVHYQAHVWINGQPTMQHSSGGLPFEAEIENFVNFGAANRLTVSCDNRLGPSTVPQRAIDSSGEVHPQQKHTFDFFNYAGIHRSVHLYSTPRIFISDIDVDTEFLPSERVGLVGYRIFLEGDFESQTHGMKYYIHVQLQDQQGQVVAQQIRRHPFKGSLQVSDAHAWWPYLMDPQPGYLYRLQLELYRGEVIGEESDQDEVLDVYRLPVGIRSLNWSDDSFLLNGKPLYLRGFGRHEDSDVRGRGLDYPMMLHDFNLLKWVGANVYRTSHYPYSEESMQLADEQGIMIIDECSALNIVPKPVNLRLLQNHMSVLEQLIHRDRNHPSVIAWSVANEPSISSWQGPDKYFPSLIAYTRQIAHGRPLTAALSKPSDITNQITFGKLLDIVGVNRYSGWYQNPAELDRIVDGIVAEAMFWRNATGKPVLLMEYGADSANLYRSLPSVVGTPDYQRQLLARHFQAFDRLRQKSWFLGELVWNFADFQTAQRVDSKGIFSRNRQPKEMAYDLRRRYFDLARQLDQAKVPRNLEEHDTQWSVSFARNDSEESD